MKLFGYHVHILISKFPIDKEKLGMLKEGTAHIGKNPKRKEKDTEK